MKHAWIIINITSWIAYGGREDTKIYLALHRTTRNSLLSYNGGGVEGRVEVRKCLIYEAICLRVRALCSFSYFYNLKFRMYKQCQKHVRKQVIHPMSKEHQPQWAKDQSTRNASGGETKSYERESFLLLQSI